LLYRYHTGILHATIAARPGKLVTVRQQESGGGTMLEDRDDALGQPDPEGLLDPDEAEPAAPARPTRGLVWVFGPAVLGGLAGGVLTALQLVKDGEALATASDALLHGAAVGAGLGLAGGALVWAFFPYRGNEPEASATDRR